MKDTNKKENTLQTAEVFGATKKTNTTAKQKVQFMNELFDEICEHNCIYASDILDILRNRRNKLMEEGN